MNTVKLEGFLELRCISIIPRRGGMGVYFVKRPSSTTGAAYALSETERYNSGYSHGYMDVKDGATSYCSTTGHTYTYCQGYNAGCQEGRSPNQEEPTPQPTSGCGPGTDNTTCPNQEQPTSGCGPGADDTTCPNQEQPTSGINYTGICQTL